MSRYPDIHTHTGGYSPRASAKRVLVSGVVSTGCLIFGGLYFGPLVTWKPQGAISSSGRIYAASSQR